MKKTALLLISIFLTNSAGYCVSITDDFAVKTLKENQTVKDYSYKPIYDDFAEKNENKNSSRKIKVEYNEILPDMPENEINRVKNIDYNNIKPVKIQIKKYYTTGSKLQEGDCLEFKTAAQAVINNKTYPKGTTVKARIETISPNESMGVPADLVVGSFSIEDNRLIGEISKTGANRTLWVYPLSYGTLAFFGIGLLFMPIRGGHAKIRPSQVYTIYTD